MDTRKQLAGRRAHAAGAQFEQMIDVDPDQEKIH